MLWVILGILPWLFLLQIVMFEMFLFNEITGPLSKPEKKIGLFFESLYKEANLGGGVWGFIWKQSGFDFSYNLIFFIIFRLF